MRTRVFTKRLLHRWHRFGSEQRGAAAVEFALVLSLLTVPVLNVVDVAMYAWARMQVDNAAQVGAQAAWATCSLPTNLPATIGINCQGMSNAVAVAIKSTSLGANVTVMSKAENYYCVVASALYTTGTFPGNKPSDCSQWGGASTDQAGDYIQITVSYTYSSIFPGASVASLLATPITRQAWMRLG